MNVRNQPMARDTGIAFVVGTQNFAPLHCGWLQTFIKSYHGLRITSNLFFWKFRHPSIAICSYTKYPGSFTPSIKSKPLSAVQPCLQRFPPRFSSRLRREKRGGKEHGARPPAVCGLITGAKLRPTWRMAVMHRRSVFHCSRFSWM